MKRILFLSYTSHQQDIFFKGMSMALSQHGHRVKHVCQSPVDGTRYDWISYCSWATGDFFEIDNFEPHVIVVLNGRAKEIRPFIWLLRANHCEQMFFIERGWLPQKDNIYLDRGGVGADSYLSKCHLGCNYSGELYQLEEEFLDEDYIFIPLQLEHDTSIIDDSPVFKTMNSLVHMVAGLFPSKKIIIKDHPLSKQCYNFSHLENVTIDISGKHSLQWAKNSSFIVGINSTVLIESLKFLKPVYMLGDGVLKNSRIAQHTGECLFGNFSDLLNYQQTGFAYKVSPRLVQNVLSWLSDTQFSASSPPLRKLLEYF
jgi:hypothetical protein